MYSNRNGSSYGNRGTSTLFFLLLLAAAVSQLTEAKSLLRRDGNVNQNVNDQEGLEGRSLGRLSKNYVEPVWFDSYKAIAGRAFKRCKPLNNVAPGDGSKCPMIKGRGDYSCAFEDQTCPDGSIHPKIKCDCSRRTGLWSCEKYKPCEVTPPVTTCPKKHPIKFNPPLTCSEGLICPIGKQKCCGTIFPRFVCTCKDGVFKCDDDNSCSGKCDATPVPLPSVAPVPSPVPTNSPLSLITNSPMIETAPPNPRTFDCPNAGSLIPPERGTPCNLDASTSCKYDKACCCANCVDRYIATCKFDVWEVVTIAVDCLPGPCPPTPSPGSLETAAPTGQLTFACPNQDSIIPPTQGSECNVSQTQLCKYDETCCCGSCVDRFYCSCVAGMWSCTELAFDCLPCVDPVVTCPVPTDAPYPNGECTLPLDKVCGYGEVCCCDNCVVETSCQCNFGTWLCSTLDLVCTETCPPQTTNDIIDVVDPITEIPPFDPVTSCPIPLDMDVSINGTMCALPDATECNYGKICCCDSCIERFYCSCYGGAWICSELAFRCGPCDATTTECPIIEDPSISPVPVGSCNVPQENECTYGKTCCCDNCIDEFYCHCESGTWSCAQLAFGCMGPCPPPENGQPCEPNSVIENGVFECCGTISPQWTCRCGRAGTYECTTLFPPGVVCSCAPPPDELFLLDSPPELIENATIRL